MSSNVLMTLSAPDPEAVDADQRRLRFAVGSAAFEEMTRSITMRWPSQPLIGRRPVLQGTGVEEETLEIKGVVFPHIWGGLGQVEAIRQACLIQRPRLMTDGLGNVWGHWVLKALEEQRKHFTVEGAPLRQEYRLKLLAYGER